MTNIASMAPTIKLEDPGVKIEHPLGLLLS